jgi:hypothetical protein
MMLRLLHSQTGLEAIYEEEENEFVGLRAAGRDEVELLGTTANTTSISIHQDPWSVFLRKTYKRGAPNQLP